MITITTHRAARWERHKDCGFSLVVSSDPLAPSYAAREVRAISLWRRGARICLFRQGAKEVYAMTYERAIARLADVCGEEWIRSIPAPEGL